MSAIDDLWDDGKLPIRDALHFSGGSSYDASTAEPAEGRRSGSYGGTSRRRDATSETTNSTK
jgi:hypothetical protein